MSATPARSLIERGPVNDHTLDFALGDKVVLLTEAQPDDANDLPAYLAAAGARLALGSADLESLAPTLDALSAHGADVRAYNLDFQDLESIPRAVEQCLADFGRIDVLVNNVGFNIPSWALDVTPEEWARIVQINATGPFFCAQAVGKHMVANKRGRIINVGTHSGIKPNKRRAAYGSARAAMAQYTRNLALEWADSNVTVNSVAPAFIKPVNLEKYPEMYGAMRERNPMGRFATEAEVAAAIIFLASDAAAFVTGQVLVVDGGSSL